MNLFLRIILLFSLAVFSSQSWSNATVTASSYNYDVKVEYIFAVDNAKNTTLNKYSSQAALCGCEYQPFFPQVGSDEEQFGRDLSPLLSLLLARRPNLGNVTKSLANPVPETVARVVSDTPITRASGTLGRPGADDVFITSASDIRGLNAKQIAERLTIPESPTGFRVIEFPTPKSGIASPVNRTDLGFIGGGRTAGGTR